MSTILVSIDGREEHTNERRGKEVYKKVIKNVRKIRDSGFSGEIIARMTVDETADIYKDVIHLLNIKYFDSVHWQIDAGFWEDDYKKRNFSKWTKLYNQGIKNLINYWINLILNEKKVLRIYPFNVLMYDLIKGNKTGMRCGAGHSCLGIQTDGKITACPITAGFKKLYMGDINNSSLDDIINNFIGVEGECVNCDIKDICGGRCLYSNKSKLWPLEEKKKICNTIFFLVNELKSNIDIIKREITKGNISLEDFNLPRYNGCEIIP